MKNKCELPAVDRTSSVRSPLLDSVGRGGSRTFWHGSVFFGTRS